MTDDEKGAWAAVRAINAAWLRGTPGELGELFDEAAVIEDAEGKRLVEGRDACVASYRAFADEARVRRFVEAEPRVVLAGVTAIVGYRYEIEYELAGRDHREIGREVVVLARSSGRWRALWRQAGSRPA